MRRPIAVAVLACAGVLLAPGARAFAHPLGNFTVNRYAGIVVSTDVVTVTYVIDMAEIPTLQELPAIDADHDGAMSGAELQGWASAQAPALSEGLHVSIGGQPLAITASSASATLRPGQGGLSTLRFEGSFAGQARASGSLSFTDANEDGRVGWHEVTLAGDGVTVSKSAVPSTSISDALMSYPQDMLSSPLDVSAVTADLTPGGPALGSDAAAQGAAGTSIRPGTELGGFTGLLSNHGAPLVMLGLLIALVLGAWHALLPGHGKTIMAAAMIGSGAKVRQAATVAVAVALMHTASVLALGIAVLALQQTFRPDALYPWLGVLSGVAAVAVGFYLLRTRLAAWRHQHTHGASTHGDHEHVHPHPHVHGAAGRRGLLAIALAGGILPAPSALLVMLGAIQAHRAAYGVTLVLAFSVGLAGALLAVGAGALRARDAVAKRLSARVGLVVPMVSAAAILVVGLAVAVRAAAAV
jgi:ABC-type nickel/cobalt efflux system permease component RcnA